MALPFEPKRFDCAVMALVIFFVPDPAKGIAEMARVVRPGGLIAAYAWDVLGGGFPFDPIWEATRAVGVTPLLPPNPSAGRLETLRGLWTTAGLVEVETREIAVERTFATFEDYWTTSTITGGRAPSSGGNVGRGTRRTEGAGAYPPANRFEGACDLERPCQRGQSARSNLGAGSRAQADRRLARPYYYALEIFPDPALGDTPTSSNDGFAPRAVVP
jgi:hypothetical protein